MAVLCKKAKELKGTFLTFQINHVLRVGLTFLSFYLVNIFHHPALCCMPVRTTCIIIIPFLMMRPRYNICTLS